jgi:hypothetical protein
MESIGACQFFIVGHIHNLELLRVQGGVGAEGNDSS